MLNKSAAVYKTNPDFVDVLFSPYYCIRPWLNVPGKCDTCYEIDKVPRGTQDSKVLNACKQAHILHKAGMFARERREYKRNSLEAKIDPEVLEMIIDGMDQFHSRVPYGGKFFLKYNNNCSVNLNNHLILCSWRNRISKLF